MLAYESRIQTTTTRTEQGQSTILLIESQSSEKNAYGIALDKSSLTLGGEQIRSGSFGSKRGLVYEASGPGSGLFDPGL